MQIRFFSCRTRISVVTTIQVIFYSTLVIKLLHHDFCYPVINFFLSVIARVYQIANGFVTLVLIATMAKIIWTQQLAFPQVLAFLVTKERIRQILDQNNVSPAPRFCTCMIDLFMPYFTDECVKNW
jgi:hypothetical protein